MIKKAFLLFLLSSSFVFANETTVLRRIYNHLLLSDFENANKEAFAALNHYPNSSKVYEMTLRCLAKSGDDRILSVWQEFYALFPKEAMKQPVLEELGWGILEKGRLQSGLASQLLCLVAAAMTQDARALSYLLDGLNHTSAHIRIVAIQLAALYRDYPLKMELKRLFQREKSMEVRAELIKAFGKLKMQELQSELLHILTSPRSQPKEVKAAIKALVEMQEGLESNQLQILLQHKRANLRLLGCELILRYAFCEHVSLLFPLLEDSDPEVCASALRALGVLPSALPEKVKILALSSRDDRCRLSAAWAYFLHEPQRGIELMQNELLSKNPAVRRFAAACIASSGEKGVEIAKKVLEESEDPYVKANLALVLIAQREDVEKAAAALEQFLSTQKENLMWQEVGHFKFLQKSNAEANPLIANYPEALDQATRLEILNLLAILEYPNAEEAIKKFLKSSHYQVTGLAAELLLGEGDETAIEIVRGLMEDPDKKVALEAALILAVWGKERAALPKLIGMYPEVERRLQIRILEALGRVGSREALDFFIERLQEPSMSIKMIAACCMIMTLNL